MGLFGDLITGALGGYPQKPNVPAFTPVDVGVEQQKAIAENLAALPASEKLAGQVNVFNEQQIQQMLRSAIPNYDAIVGGVSGDIASMVRGEIPTDVSEAVHRSAAGEALKGGYGGTGMGRNLVARDLGINSFIEMREGISSAQSWLTTMNNLTKPGFFNLASMFVSPEFQTATDVSERDKAWNVSWLRNQMSAIPDPERAAIARDVGNIGDTIGNMIPYVGAVNMASGGMGGGGSGGGGLGGLFGLFGGMG